MRVFVPFDARTPKTRLSDVLDSSERVQFAAAMLRDVLDAVRAAGGEPELLATGTVDHVVSTEIPVTVDDRPLTPAVNAVLDAADEPIAIVMADLALATPHSLRRLFDAEGDVVAAPGRGGGTNALVVRDQNFRVDYHGASFRDHRQIAARIGASFATIDSHRLSTDIDDRADLVELLLHGNGDAGAWLVDAGFCLETGEGRVTVSQSGDSERLK